MNSFSQRPILLLQCEHERSELDATGPSEVQIDKGHPSVERYGS